MDLARGHHADSELFGFGYEPTLAPLALRCATNLSPDAATCDEIEHLGIAQLGTIDNIGQWHTIGALAALPDSPQQLDPRLCAAHPAPALRALAGVRWVKNNPDALPPYIEALAHDPDHRVRRDLATAIRSSQNPTSTTSSSLAKILNTDVRRSIRILVTNIAP